MTIWEGVEGNKDAGFEPACGLGSIGGMWTWLHLSEEATKIAAPTVKSRTPTVRTADFFIERPLSNGRLSG